ncbi:hypothetical protein [Janthinobacterium sp. GMG1]|uniref:hypothetical protein n=1 Tax=Janthinobacterium sp. GMG1 TaxID=3096007 RepID=UPI002ACAB5C2|nr:hypothetical protein [Janthinobacterium sp. GMG1]MDZ5633967.1 hypothetical protein [Janthinobacterium sp. GMG1]
MWKLANKHASNVVTFVLIAGLLIFFGYTIRIWPTLLPGDKGTWSGALGTVGTLIGTIWLATSESRRRNREEMTRAQLHAAGILLDIAYVRGELKLIVDEMAEFALIDPITNRILSFAPKLSIIDIWKAETFIPLVPLPNKAAGCLTQATDQIRLMRRVIEKAGHDNSLDSSEKRKKFICSAHKLLVGTMALLDTGIAECQAAGRAMHLS